MGNRRRKDKSDVKKHDNGIFKKNVMDGLWKISFDHLCYLNKKTEIEVN